ncbi:MAG TPA: CUAEP/CCAEP-tail radical SAM protein, partial [bacterium]|nr:CUAEP/CCAEP-tail radical SAM protein [bacterium]
MKAPGEILLLSCYELGHQPLAVASAAAFLERAGFAPDVLDLSLEKLDAAKVERAKLAAISVPMHTALRLGVKAAARLRAINPSVRVCFFGLYAALNAEWLLGQGHADAVLGGEADEALVALARGEGGASSVTVARLDYPVPSRARLPQVGRYARAVVNGEERVAAAIETTRGCLHLCRHCPIPAVYDGRFFAVPLETVLADVRALAASGVRHLTIADPDFWNGPAHARRVVEAIHAEFPALTFDATIKVEHLLAHREMLPALASSGCVFVVSAVESLSDRVLEILDKGHTRADVAEAFRLARGAGIALRPSLLPFTPWSTLEDYADLLEWIADEDLAGHVDPVQLSI